LRRACSITSSGVAPGSLPAAAQASAPSERWVLMQVNAVQVIPCLGPPKQRQEPCWLRRPKSSAASPAPNQARPGRSENALSKTHLDFGLTFPRRTAAHGGKCPGYCELPFRNPPPSKPPNPGQQIRRGFRLCRGKRPRHAKERGESDEWCKTVAPPESCPGCGWLQGGEATPARSRLLA